LRGGSGISSTVFGGVDTTAGNITIDPRFLILDESDILAQADQGTGGSIAIQAENILRSPGSRIDASSRLGIDGTVVVSSPEVDLTGGLVELEVPLLDAASLLRERCAARRDIGASSFTGVGRGGLPPGPDQPLMSDYRIGPARPGASARSGDIEPAPAVLALACGGAL
jgi:large exoprotein involved in heme utilization and adhesion